MMWAVRAPEFVTLKQKTWLMAILHVGTGFAAVYVSGSWFDNALEDKDAGTMSGLFLIVQVALAVLVVVFSKGKIVEKAAFLTLMVICALWCSFVLAMSLSGTWL